MPKGAVSRAVTSISPEMHATQPFVNLFCFASKSYLFSEPSAKRSFGYLHSAGSIDR